MPRILAIAALSALILARTSAPALADDALPSADTVLNQFVEATGGKAAYDKVKNRSAQGTLEVAGAGIKGTIKVLQAAPNKIVIETEIPNVEKSSQGTNGEVAWSTSLLTGDRILDGEEKASMLLQAALDSEINWRKYYAKAECTGVEDVDGKPAYRVVLTSKEGKPTSVYYDKASHLAVKSVSTTKGPMGEIPIESFPSDYRKVGGVLLPFVAKQKILTQEVILTLTEIKENVDLPADAFNPPASVKALVDKTKKDK